MRIIIADDDINILDVFASLLLKHNVDIDVADNFKLAKSLLLTNTYDLAIFDYHLDEGTGLQLLKLLRQTSPKYRAFIVSGDADDPELQVEAKRLGAEAVLPKPIFGKELIARVFGELRR